MTEITYDEAVRVLRRAANYNNVVSVVLLVIILFTYIYDLKKRLERKQNGLPKMIDFVDLVVSLVRAVLFIWIWLMNDAYYWMSPTAEIQMGFFAIISAGCIVSIIGALVNIYQVWTITKSLKMILEVSYEDLEELGTGVGVSKNVQPFVYPYREGDGKGKQISEETKAVMAGNNA